MLPTVQALSEAAKRKRKKGVMIEPTTTKNKDTRAQGHDRGSKARAGGCSSQRVRVQLTESAGVDVDDEFSWC